MGMLTRRATVRVALRSIALSAAILAAPGAHAAAADVMSATTTAASDDARLVAQITARLAGKPGVRAQFRQTQTLAALKAPLVSTGSLLFMRERGVIWRIDTPYRTTYVIGDSGVTQIDASGERRERAGPRAGGMAQMSRMMRAMLGGDLSALYSQFDVTASGTPAQWRMRLTPNQPQLAQALKELRMEGGAFLQTLSITAANGDSTRIEFADSVAVDVPSPAERALLGAP